VTSGKRNPKDLQLRTSANAASVNCARAGGNPPQNGGWRLRVMRDRCMHAPAPRSVPAGGKPLCGMPANSQPALRANRHSDGAVRRVVESSFAILELVGALQPARLVDLTDVSGMPHPSVHRLLALLIWPAATPTPGPVTTPRDTTSCHRRSSIDLSPRTGADTARSCLICTSSGRQPGQDRVSPARRVGLSPDTYLPLQKQRIADHV
jgi:hypothetical protein